MQGCEAKFIHRCLDSDDAWALQKSLNGQRHHVPHIPRSNPSVLVRSSCKHPRFYRIFAEKSPAPAELGIIRSEAVKPVSTRVESDARIGSEDVDVSSPTAVDNRRRGPDHRHHAARPGYRQPPDACTSASPIRRRSRRCGGRCRSPWPSGAPGCRRGARPGPVAESSDAATFIARRRLVSHRLRCRAIFCRRSKCKSDSPAPRL